jgi:glycosyltransferase 2 family protein
VLRLILLLVGLFTFAGLIWHIGPANILSAVAGIGPLALLVILVPSLLMYLLEAYGWRLTLRNYAAAVPFGRLLAIRTAGEVVNMTTPTAYVGGEPLKAVLLKPHGVPMIEALASVITAKTTMTIAQVLFILIGIGLAFGLVGTSASGDSNASLLAALVGVGLLLFGIALFVMVQRIGLFLGLLNVLRWCRIRIAYLEAREEKLRELDRTILDFYTRDRPAFLLSIGFFFLGWMAEALEVYVILYFIGGPPASPLAAIAIGALSVFIKGGTFFIPGSLGAQEGGNLLVLVAFGYSDVTGITFALLRRVRELVWIAIGLGCLAALGGRKAVASEEVPR